MIKTITKKTYVNEDGFNFTFEPIEDTLKIIKTKDGFEARYLTQDTEPINPREDENYSTMVCFHNRYSLGDKTDLKSDNFNGWKEVYDYIKNELKAIMILPLYLYDHSGISMKVGSFQGLLPQGHAEFDSGQVGFIYMTAENLKELGMDKSKVGDFLRGEVETYNQYLTGDVYCIVREDYNKNKEPINYDIVGGYYGYEKSKKALESGI
jgi:hypothetical protein